MEPLDIALRVYTPIAQNEYKGNGNDVFWPEYALIFDTETTADEQQRLNFGAYRVVRWNKNELITIEDGLFHADDLPARCPNGYAELQSYVATRASDVVSRTPKQLKLISRHEFVNSVFYPMAYNARAMVVGFNLPFDLARLAFTWYPSKSPKFKSGFSIAPATYVDKNSGELRENKYKPRIGIKSIDSKKAFIGFIKPARSNDDTSRRRKGIKHFDGYFLDLRTLVFALTSRSHSLDSACKSFGVQHEKEKVTQHGVISEIYLDYARNDVQITSELLVALRLEYDKHPIALPPYKAYSPASIGKAYVKAMGVTPRLQLQPDFSNNIIGYAMASYYGGRTECRIRKTVVPVVYCDFVSMYPTVNGLMRLWDLITCERINVIDDTDNIRSFLASLTLDDCFNPDTWRHFPVLVQLQPDSDIFPVRAQYAENEPSWNIGVNYLTDTQPFWYALPDVIASKLLAGKTPNIIKAYRLIPEGKQAGLQTVNLAGRVTINPVERDFFLSVIEQRKIVKKRADLPDSERERVQLFLKILANSTSYGIYGEMNPKEHLKKSEHVICYQDTKPFATETDKPEIPGALCFPPIATFITSAAKLMLALLERCVTDAGGFYALCDTDSMAIVSTKDGGNVSCGTGDSDSVRALSWGDVETIRQRFTSLNPYNQEAVRGSILDYPDVNYDSDRNQRQLLAYSVATKRYALFAREDDKVMLVEYKEHGLGHIFNPLSSDDDNRDIDEPRHDWRAAVWSHVLGTAGITITHVEIEHQNKRLIVPLNNDTSWYKYPSVQRITASTPNIAKRLNVLPFSFVLTVHVDTMHNTKPGNITLIAPYQRNAKKWLGMKWINIYDGKKYAIDDSSGIYDGSGVNPNSVIVETVDRSIAGYGAHQEVKSAAPDGTSCKRNTTGLLLRRHVSPQKRHYIGKESNKIEEREDGLVKDIREVQNEYKPRRCEVCGTDIGKTHRHTKTCSDKCRKQSSRNRITDEVSK